MKEQFKNQIELENLGDNIDKIIKFCNLGSTLIVGGFYDGRVEIIYLEDKVEKSRKEIFPFSENEPILNISINKEESFMILGNIIGNIAIYKIDLENEKWELYKKIFNQMNAISDININDDLNLFTTCSIDGFVNLYTLPLCKMVRSIKVPINDENNGKLNYIFLSESSLPSIIIIIEEDKNCEILSYSINGRFLNSIKENAKIESTSKIKDLNSLEYLAYFVDTQIYIRNLPSLSLQIIIEKIFGIKSLCINEDLSVIYTFNEDGTQIQAIKD